MYIEEIVNEYGRYIYKYAMKLACDPQKAEDIVQETFISAWKSIGQLRDEQAIKKWLRTICFNHLLMDYRKNKNGSIELHDSIEALEAEGNVLVTQIANPEEEIIVEDSIRKLQNGCFYAMVRKLTLHQRITFSLIDMFGLSISEVAEILQVSEPAAKGLLYRARMNLDSFFAEHCNLIDVKNPCSCQAWINFRISHEKNQKAAKNMIESLEHNEKTYRFNQAVRNKINYLYQNMPDEQPEEKWFDDIINSLKNI
jgi:RNA polymerase sigma factor (sigma-70 family)